MDAIGYESYLFARRHESELGRGCFALGKLAGVEVILTENLQKPT